MPPQATDHQLAFRRGLGLKFKFSAAIIFLIICVMGLVTAVVRYRVRESLLEQIMVKGEALCRGLAAQAAEALVTGDKMHLTVLVDQTLQQEKGITAAAVVDSRQIILAHSDFKREGQPYRQPGQAVFRKISFEKISQYFAGRQEVLDFEVPVMVTGTNQQVAKQLGSAHVVYSLAPINRVVATALEDIFYVALSGLLLGIFISIWLVGRITRPIRQLARATETIGTGNLDIQIPVKRRDELGQLSSAFNLMAANLKHAQAELIVKERLQNEMEIAQRIQGMLVPKQSPKIPGFSLSKLYSAAEEVSGDYFDFIDLGKGFWGMTVADVSGKGVPGALVMAQTRSVLRSIANLSHSPSKVLSKTNLQMYRDLPENMFVTISYLVLDAAKRAVTISRAGHLAAIIFRKATRTCELEMPTGIAIGISDPDTFDLMLSERSVKLNPGDFILLYTDGVDEATNTSKDLFGSERLMETLKQAAGLTAEAIVERVEQAVKAFVGPAPQNDDITMILVKLEEGAQNE